MNPYFKRFIWIVDLKTNTKLTYVNWKGQINHPKTFTIEDCDELEKVNYLMARKFDEDFDDKIINKLYDEL